MAASGPPRWFKSPNIWSAGALAASASRVNKVKLRLTDISTVFILPPVVVCFMNGAIASHHCAQPRQTGLTTKKFFRKRPAGSLKSLGPTELGDRGDGVAQIPVTSAATLTG